MKSTAIAPSNIAFIKYWGKKDTVLNLPLNPSISMTLDDSVSTTTTVEFGGYPSDSFSLNDVEQKGDALERVKGFVDLIRSIAHIDLKARVVSKNNFPTGAGMASSASGFAALALSASSAAGLELARQELSELARQGSGSACRSIYSGFNIWTDHYSQQICDDKHWPELIDLVVILDDGQKKVSSREAMRMTVQNRAHLDRVKNLGPLIRLAEKAIIERDLKRLCRIIMDDSDAMHTSIRDAGINYLNQDSESIKKIIINMSPNIDAAYTFDAGPNAHIICLEKDLDHIRRAIQTVSRKTIEARQGQGTRLIEKHLF